MSTSGPRLVRPQTTNRGGSPPLPPPTDSSASSSDNNDDDRRILSSLIVGVNGEWSDGRDDVGDVALYGALKDLLEDEKKQQRQRQLHSRRDVGGGSSSTSAAAAATAAFASGSSVRFLKDGQATRRNVLRHLKELLEGDEGDGEDVTSEAGREERARGRLFLFYFGGHGVRDGFCASEDDNGDDAVIANDDADDTTADDDDGDNRDEAASSSSSSLLRYSEIVNAVLSSSSSLGQHPDDEAWFLVDCCYSGSFGRNWLAAQSKMQFGQSAQRAFFPYVCVMSTESDRKAGGSWTLTRCFLDAMRRRNTRAGTHGESSPSSTSLRRGAASATSVFSTEEFLRITSNEILKEKWNVVTVLHGTCGGPDDEERSFPRRPVLKRPFPFRLASALRVEDDNDANDNSGTTVVDFPSFAPRPARIGDPVIAKWYGVDVFDGSNDSRGCSSAADPAERQAPCWYRGTVVSVSSSSSNLNDDNIVEVEYCDSISQRKWKSAVRNSAGDLIDERQWDALRSVHWRKEIGRAHVLLARHLKYISYSSSVSFSVNTAVSVLWPDDNKSYPAKRCSNDSFPWGDEATNLCLERYPDRTGPFVPVWWFEEDTYSLVPVEDCRIVVQNELSEGTSTVPTEKKEADGDSDSNMRDSELTTAATALVRTPRDALWRSFSSAGKTLILDPSSSAFEELFGTTTRLVSGYWVPDGKWHGARVLKTEDFCVCRPHRDADEDYGNVQCDDCFLHALADHVRYPQAGPYCLVEWEEHDDNDELYACLPVAFLRART